MKEVGYVFPFGTSAFFVYFVGYAIWLTFWRPKRTYDVLWKLGSSAFFGGIFLAFSIAVWMNVEGMLLGLLTTLMIWTIILVAMSARIVRDRVALIRDQEALERRKNIPIDGILRGMTDERLDELMSRAYAIILERDIKHDLQSTTEGHYGVTVRLTTPGG